MKQIIAQAAEAIIYREENKVYKDRLKKSYRIPEIDEKLRKSRTKSEAKIIEKAGRLIPSPKILKTEKFQIEMEFIDGKKLSENLDKFTEKRQLEISEQIGKNTAKLHDNNIIHGDLTTSNMIINECGDKIYFIDFGLSFISNRIEDKAVDLHLLKQALEAKHFKKWEKLFKSFLKGYSESKNYKDSVERLKKVESRGRYKH